MSVVKNSVAQIACFLFPALVLLSLFFSDRLTFVLNPVYIGALAVTALAVWQITGDGEAYAYEGLALVAIYVDPGDGHVLRVARRRAAQRRHLVARSARATRPARGPRRSSPA